jgi:hypothetical protein
VTITVAVTLRCDGRGEGCEISCSLGHDPDPAAVTAHWRPAHELGWSKYPQPDGKPTLHLCPTCNAHRLAGDLVTEAQRQRQSSTPEEGWPAALDDWQQRRAAKQGEERRLAEAQREPGESYAWPPGWQERARRRVVWGDMMNRRPGAAEE